MKQVMKKVWRILQKIIISTFILYGYNLIATRFNLVIPINVFTVGSVSILGFPMLFLLVLLKVLMF